MGENHQGGRRMIPQGILPFHLERSEKEITPHAGLTVISEAYRALKVSDSVRRYLPHPGSNRGFSPEVYVETLLLLLCGGGNRLEEVRQLEEDVALQRVIGVKKFPSSDALGDWLRRMGEQKGYRALEKVGKGLVRKALEKTPENEFTLDIDAVGIEAEKRDAAMTYAGYRGYMPIMAYLAENGLCVFHEFRSGNTSVAEGIKEILGVCQVRLPEGKRIKYFRSDSAGYQADVINTCFRDGITFAIVADLDSAVREAISEIPKNSWKRFKTKDGIPMDKEIAETVHIQNRGERAFRLIVQRWRPAQLSLFTQDGFGYHAIATNSTLPAEEAVHWYNGRCNSENFHKELKGGFGMEYVPCGELEANAVFFSIGVLAYNLVIALKRIFLPESWWSKTIHTLRWELIQVAGHLVHHSRQWILKVSGIPDEIFELWRVLRWQLLLETG